MSSLEERLVLAGLGFGLLAIAGTDAYLRYLQPAMHLPLLISAAVLIGLAVIEAVRVPRSAAELDQHLVPGTHGPPGVAWLLLLPVLCFLAFDPPALGSFSARRSIDVPPASAALDDGADGFLPLPAKPAVASLPLIEYSIRALYDTNETLAGRTLSLTGFVVRGEKGWSVTRMAMSCCAADAVAVHVRVLGIEPPPEDQWVQVTGTWAATPGADPHDLSVIAPGPARITAVRVVPVTAPTHPYE